MRPLRLTQRLLRPLSAPPFVFGLALAFSAPIPGWLALAAAHTHGSSALPFVALAPLAFAPFLLRLVPWPARTSIACALFLASLAPFVYLIASWSLHLPIVKGSGLPGANHVPHDIESALVFSLFGIPLLAAPLIALVSSRFRPRVDAALRALALGATLALGALTFFAASRVKAKSTPTNYLASLPIASALRPCGLSIASPRGHMDDTSFSIHLGDVLIRRTCFHDAGETEVLMPNGAVPVWLPRITRRASVALLARHDSARDLWFLEVHPRGGTSEFIAFDAHGRPVDTSPAALAPALSPPSSWTGGALLGFFISTMLLLRTRELRRALRADADLPHAREGFLDRRGWIHFEDGAPPLRAPALNLPPGLVTVFPAKQRPGSIYRSDGAINAEHIEPGSRAARRAAHQTALTALAAFAFATAVLTAAPLIAAARAGLVF